MQLGVGLSMGLARQNRFDSNSIIPKLRFKYDANSENLTIVFGIKLINDASSVTINWGDGNISTPQSDGVLRDVSHTYQSDGFYTITITSPSSFLIFNYSGNGLCGSISQFSLADNLTELEINLSESQSWTGSIDNLPSGLTSLSLIRLGGNCTGSISNLPSGIVYLSLDEVGQLTGSMEYLNSEITFISLKNLGRYIGVSALPLLNAITYFELSCGYSSADINTLLYVMSSSFPDLNPNTGQIFLGGNQTPTFNDSHLSLDTLESYGYTLDFGDYGNEWVLFHYVESAPRYEEPHTIMPHLFIRFKKSVQSVGNWLWWDVKYCDCPPELHLGQCIIDTPQQTTRIFGATNKWISRYFETDVTQAMVNAVTNFTTDEDGVVFTDTTELPEYINQKFCNLSTVVGQIHWQACLDFLASLGG